MATLVRAAWRSLFLEASWNNQGQQNLGLAAAVDPALVAIYGQGEELRQARLRALEYFNTNPLASGVVIGVLIRMEEDLAAGRRSLEERVRVVGSLYRTLAAMGDSLFWQSWLPLCCLAAVWAVLSIDAWWTPLILPGLFCLPALPVRFLGLLLGYRRGDNITDLLFRLQIQRLAQGIKRTLALMVGVSTAILLSTRTILGEVDSAWRLWLTMVSVVICVMALRFLSTRTRALHYWYPIILVTVASLLMITLDKIGK